MELPPAVRAAADNNISEAALRAHIQFLADDLLEGRGPGSRGDHITQKYLATQFQSFGLQPAGENGSWFQSFPLVGVQTHSPAHVIFHNADRSLQLQRTEDFVFASGKPKAQSGFQDAELVFVGYGIVAPEFDWDDYKDADLKGKVLVMMNNDPSSDPELFAGNRRLYYGRWDYKYLSAARQGAVGAIIIHTEASAGYPYQVVQTSWSGEEFELADNDDPRMEMRGWITESAAKRVFELSKHGLDDLRAAAEKRDFRPVPLGTTLSVAMTCDVRKKKTGNVLAILPGADPQLSDEVVIYMAHHDHLGMAAERDADGDNIYNGAVDNASGTAALLSIARTYAAMAHAKTLPNRSVLFAAVGAEEQGLLGSLYFSQHPTISPGKIAAVINIDGVNIFGRSHDVNVVGFGKSSLDKIVSAVAKSQNRFVTPDQFPDRGYYYRSDQFSLAKIGVPGVYLHGGTRIVGKPEGWGKQQKDDWVKRDYHQPSDEYREDWDLTGAIEDVQLLFETGWQVAMSPDFPHWVPGDEFEEARIQAIRASEGE